MGQVNFRDRPLFPTKSRAGLALTLFLALDAGAEERKWLESHSHVVPGSEYTLIATSDDRSPRLARMHYQDDQGERLVLRFKTEGGGPSKTTIVSVRDASSLSITIGVNDQVTLGYGSGFIAYQDPKAPSASARKQALAVLAAYPQPFQGALQRLATSPAGCTADFGVVATVLRALMFTDAPPCPEAGATTATPTEVVKDFDPGKTPPGAFERPFGRAYFH